MRFEHRVQVFYLFNLAEVTISLAELAGYHASKIATPVSPLKVILFSALPIQTIGQAALPDLNRQIWILRQSSSPDPDNLNTPVRSV